MTAARPRIVLVAAVARDGTIGAAGRMPWHFPDDLRAFRAATTGTALVMGRKTFDSIGRVLPGRLNVVITRNPAAFAAAHPDAVATDSLGRALDEAAARGNAVASVIGGGEVYALALPLADEMLVTYVPHDGGGDTFFPAWDAAEWDEVAREPVGPCTRVRYRRIR